MLPQTLKAHVGNTSDEIVATPKNFKNSFLVRSIEYLFSLVDIKINGKDKMTKSKGCLAKIARDNDIPVAIDVR